MSLSKKVLRCSLQNKRISYTFKKLKQQAIIQTSSQLKNQDFFKMCEPESLFFSREMIFFYVNMNGIFFFVKPSTWIKKKKNKIKNSEDLFLHVWKRVLAELFFFFLFDHKRLKCTLPHVLNRIKSIHIFFKGSFSFLPAHAKQVKSFLAKLYFLPVLKS